MQAKSDAVAVITVHGVGSPQPGTMARELAGLLQRANGGTYTEFKESLLELEVRSVGGGDAEDSVIGSGKEVPWYIRTRYVSKRTAKEKAPAASDDRNASYDIVFTHEAVSGAMVDADLSRYRSLLLSGERRDDSITTRVDVYEMHWADLSHLGGWIGRVLGEFYQILFHAAQIGQKTVELAWLRSRGDDRSHLASVLGAQAIAEGMLGGALPLFNLALLLALVPMAAVFISNEVVRAGLCGAAVAAVMAAVLCAGAWRARVSSTSDHAASLVRGWALTLALLLAGAVGTLAGYLVYDAGERATRVLVFLLLTGACFAAYLALAQALIRRRKKSSWAPHVINGVVMVMWGLLLALGMLWFPMSAPADEIRIAFFIGEGLFVAITMAWSIFIVAGWAACLFGFHASARTRDPKTRAAVWTGKIGLFVPASFFFIVNIIAWHLVYRFLAANVLGGVWYGPGLLAAMPAPGIDLVACTEPTLATDCMGRILQAASGPAFAMFILIVALAVGLLLAALLPSIRYESSPVHRSSERASAALGNWLDSGWFVLRASGYCFIVGLLIIVPALQIMEFTRWSEFLIQYGVGSRELLAWFSAAFVGGAGLAVAFRDALSKGLTRAIGILFDVDNWLKERPIETNPRGRILLRYLALLRHVREQGYRRIVVVSHSQGTVITADLLRLLKVYPEFVGTGGAPIHLMTFGSPLRQLYGLRFPDLYGWARAQPEKRDGKLVLPISTDYPDRHSLFEVDHWVNCYRSGDYVGRFFWTAEDQWKPSQRPPEADVAEFCLVAGAHTHYFDHAAIEVGRVIDTEICPYPITGAGLRPVQAVDKEADRKA